MTRRTSIRRQTAKRQRTNPLDAAGITYIDYKDTDLLRKFISDRGKIRSRRVTHVTPAAAADSAGHQERTRDGAPALQLPIGR
jgi:ribosomal protein S18